MEKGFGKQDYFQSCVDDPPSVVADSDLPGTGAGLTLPVLEELPQHDHKYIQRKHAKLMCI